MSDLTENTSNTFISRQDLPQSISPSLQLPSVRIKSSTGDKKEILSSQTHSEENTLSGTDTSAQSSDDNWPTSQSNSGYDADKLGSYESPQSSPGYFYDYDLRREL
ncbi:hypothetical protein BDV12DRAFT_123235 [Aspergillus spectabilis]